MDPHGSPDLFWEIKLFSVKYSKIFPQMRSEEIGQ